jgi:hypothetical protein
MTTRGSDIFLFGDYNLPPFDKQGPAAQGASLFPESQHISHPIAT